VKRDPEVAAHDRYKAYQRRWRLGAGFDDDKMVAFAMAYSRRMRVHDRRDRPRVTLVGNANDLLQWVAKVGSA